MREHLPCSSLRGNPEATSFNVSRGLLPHAEGTGAAHPGFGVPDVCGHADEARAGQGALGRHEMIGRAVGPAVIYTAAPRWGAVAASFGQQPSAMNK